MDPQNVKVVYVDSNKLPMIPLYEDVSDLPAFAFYYYGVQQKKYYGNSNSKIKEIVDNLNKYDTAKYEKRPISNIDEQEYQRR